MSHSAKLVEHLRGGLGVVLGRFTLHSRCAGSLLNISYFVVFVSSYEKHVMVSVILFFCLSGGCTYGDTRMV